MRAIHGNILVALQNLEATHTEHRLCFPEKDSRASPLGLLKPSSRRAPLLLAVPQDFSSPFPHGFPFKGARPTWEPRASPGIRQFLTLDSTLTLHRCPTAPEEHLDCLCATWKGLCGVSLSSPWYLRSSVSPSLIHCHLVLEKATFCSGVCFCSWF